jgi:hypothetical protein
MGENIKNGRRYLILGQNSISSPIIIFSPITRNRGLISKTQPNTLKQPIFINLSITS